jgi:hypothetical protein
VVALGRRSREADESKVGELEVLGGVQLDGPVGESFELVLLPEVVEGRLDADSPVVPIDAEGHANGRRGDQLFGRDGGTASLARNRLFREANGGRECVRIVGREPHPPGTALLADVVFLPELCREASLYEESWPTEGCRQGGGHQLQ